MDKSVKAALVALSCGLLTILALLAVPRTLVSAILELDIPGEATIAAICVGVFLMIVAILIYFWVAYVGKLLKEDSEADNLTEKK